MLLHPSQMNKSTTSAAAAKRPMVISGLIPTSSTPTGLFKAIASNDLDAASRGIAAGIKLDERNESGFTPLAWACNFGRVEIAELLLKKGADPNGLASGKMTPLHFAANGGQFAIAKLLLDCKADPRAVDARSRTAKQIASEKGFVDIAALIENAASGSAAASAAPAPAAASAVRTVASGAGAGAGAESKQQSSSSAAGESKTRTVAAAAASSASTAAAGAAAGDTKSASASAGSAPSGAFAVDSKADLEAWAKATATLTATSNEHDSFWDIELLFKAHLNNHIEVSASAPCISPILSVRVACRITQVAAWRRSSRPLCFVCSASRKSRTPSCR
jgi:hypothetical protein